MLVVVLAAAVLLAVVLSGVLIIGLAVTTRHGDPNATYKLYAVRDGLVDAVVFRGVPRDDPWLEALYENVNGILVHSNLLGGPKNWPLAVAVGSYQAEYPGAAKKLRPLPVHSRSCPEALQALNGDLRQALEHLTRNHMGIGLQMNAHERAERRIQREKAKSFLQMIRDDGRCGNTAA